METETVDHLQNEDDYYFTGNDLIPHFPYHGFLEDSFLRDMPMDPWVLDASINLTSHFAKLLMSLPKEIRHKIYSLIPLDGPVVPVEGYNHGPKNFILHRHTKPILAPTDRARRHDEFIFFSDKCGTSWAEVNRQLLLFEKRYMFDYIELDCWGDEMSVRNYQKIILYVYNLAKMEGATLNTDRKWTTSTSYSTSGAMRDVLKWF